MILKPTSRKPPTRLFATKQRTFLAVFGIAVGIGSVTAMVSAGAMVEHEALREFEELGTDVIAIRKSYSSAGFDSEGDYIRLADAMELPARLASIADLAPYAGDLRRQPADPQGGLSRPEPAAQGRTTAGLPVRVEGD